MMGNTFLFALVGLLTGAAARLFYPSRRLAPTLGTLTLGVIGGLAGGLISWTNWPEVDGQLQSGNLIMSVVGAMFAIAIWATVSYGRRIGGYKTAR